MGVHIIAEGGTNHNGRLDYAVKLADIAKEAGADSVKFQIIYPWGLYLPGEYQYGHYDIKKVIDIRTRQQLPDEDYIKLNDYCNQIGIRFSASVFDQRGLDLLTSFDPPYLKTASCDLNNLRFLRTLAQTGRRMIVSTGMSTLQDIEKAVEAITKEGNNNLVLLHCVSVYPAKLEQSNIPFIKTLKDTFGFEVGFSDHTPTSHAALMALASGATWFEKHFTFDKTLEGFDHSHAQDATEFKNYVADIRNAEIALQPKEEKITDAERYTRKRARRSLYASRDLPAGHVITDEDVLIVRPEGIMDADQIDILVGSALKNNLKQYQAFSPDDI